jgi:RecB family endonuclease NucS
VNDIKQNKLSLKTHPSLNDSVIILKEAVQENNCIIIIGCCSVKYEGRARSTLEPGERVVFIKEDKALLIHRGRGYKPVNWQPSSSYITISINNEVLKIRSVRRQPREVINITFTAIDTLLTFTLKDEGEFSLYVSEKDIQRVLIKEPGLIEAGFTPLDYEKQIDPGFIDMYGIDSHGNLVVIEIKRAKASKDAVLQLSRYIQSVKLTTERNIRGLLIADNITKSALRMLNTLNLEFKSLDLQECADILIRSNDIQKKLQF